MKKTPPELIQAARIIQTVINREQVKLAKAAAEKRKEKVMLTEHEHAQLLVDALCKMPIRQIDSMMSLQLSVIRLNDVTKSAIKKINADRKKIVSRSNPWPDGYESRMARSALRKKMKKS